MIAGVTISKATGFNAGYIEANRIGPGSKLVIIRSGDVIPHILRVLSSSTSNQPSFPSIPYKWNDTHVDIVIDGDSEQVELRQMEHFCKTLEIKHVGAGVLKKLYDHGTNTIQRLLAITETEVMAIDGFKDTMAKKIVKSVHDGFARASCADMMAASNVFGRGFGKKKIEAIIAAIPDITKRVPSVSDLEAIEGIGPNTATAFIAALPDYHKFATNIKFRQECMNSSPAKGLPAFADMTIVFTGFRNKTWEEIVSHGSGKVTSTVSKNTTLVVAADPHDTSSKIAKARDLGIPVMSKEAFATKYGLTM
jgi:DNA ligase (NAD+)